MFQCRAAIIGLVALLLVCYFLCNGYFPAVAGPCFLIIFYLFIFTSSPFFLYTHFIFSQNILSTCLSACPPAFSPFCIPYILSICVRISSLMLTSLSVSFPFPFPTFFMSLPSLLFSYSFPTPSFSIKGAKAYACLLGS